MTLIRIQKFPKLLIWVRFPSGPQEFGIQVVIIGYQPFFMGLES
jgi:hypothetical protein